MVRIIIMARVVRIIIVRMRASSWRQHVAGLISLDWRRRRAQVHAVHSGHGSALTALELGQLRLGEAQAVAHGAGRLRGLGQYRLGKATVNPPSRGRMGSCALAVSPDPEHDSGYDDPQGEEL